MENLSPEQIAVLGTSIAVNLAKDKNIDEISSLINIVGQISCTLSTIINEKLCHNKRKKWPHFTNLFSYISVKLEQNNSVKYFKMF